MSASEDLRAVRIALRSLVVAWTLLSVEDRAVAYSFGRERIELLALLGLAGAWDGLRLHNVADANCVATAAALLLKLPDLARLGDETLEKTVATVLDDRAAVFLAIVADFGLPRGERNADMGKPSAADPSRLDEQEIPGRLTAPAAPATERRAA